MDNISYKRTHVLLLHHVLVTPVQVHSHCLSYLLLFTTKYWLDRELTFLINHKFCSFIITSNCQLARTFLRCTIDRSCQNKSIPIFCNMNPFWTRKFPIIIIAIHDNLMFVTNLTCCFKLDVRYREIQIDWFSFYYRCNLIVFYYA